MSTFLSGPPSGRTLPLTPVRLSDLDGGVFDPGSSVAICARSCSPALVCTRLCSFMLTGTHLRSFALILHHLILALIYVTPSAGRTDLVSVVSRALTTQTESLFLAEVVLKPEPYSRLPNWSCILIWCVAHSSYYFGGPKAHYPVPSSLLIF